MEQAAAVIFAVLAVFVAAFQVALMLGAPWGELTLGGRWKGSLPAHARLLTLLSIVLLGVFVIVMAAHVGLAFRAVQPHAASLVWVVVAYCALGSIANAVTRSRRERALWLPVVLSMLGLSLVVATS